MIMQNRKAAQLIFVIGALIHRLGAYEPACAPLGTMTAGCWQNWKR